MKRVLTILSFIILLFINCTNHKNAMNTSDNEKLVKQYFEHFNNHEWEKMANMYAEITDFKDPSLGAGIVKQSRQQIITKYTELHQIFPDLRDNVVQVYPSGENNIIVEFISTGTAADNSKFELPICVIFTIENGLITKDFSYFDNFEE